MRSHSGIAGIACGAACLAALLACGGAPAPGGSESTPAAASAAVAPTPTPKPARTAPDEATRARLAGWWLRHDQSYMMVLDAIAENGDVSARYLNPQPVHVSKAETWVEEGDVRLLLELTDAHYPGNFYELAYQPDQDMWIGVYHHLGLGEDYEVYFVRFEDEEE
jgi:hypothetical protein